MRRSHSWQCEALPWLSPTAPPAYRYGSAPPEEYSHPPCFLPDRTGSLRQSCSPSPAPRFPLHVSAVTASEAVSSGFCLLLQPAAAIPMRKARATGSQYRFLFISHLARCKTALLFFHYTIKSFWRHDFAEYSGIRKKSCFGAAFLH